MRFGYYGEDGEKPMALMPCRWWLALAAVVGLLTLAQIGLK